MGLVEDRKDIEADLDLAARVGVKKDEAFTEVLDNSVYFLLV